MASDYTRVNIYVPPEQFEIMKRVQERAKAERQGIGYILLRGYEKSEKSESDNNEQ